MTNNNLFTPTVEERNIINECFKHQGGDGYNESLLISVVVYSMGKSISNANRNNEQLDPITFGLIASDLVNATATLHPEHGYAIGLNVGLINKIFHAAHEMYPESEGTEPIGTYWFALGAIATSFIIEHEFAHVSNGHLLLHLKHPAPPEITMTNSDDCSNKLSKLDIQTLEMDADACAVTRTVIWAVRLHRNLQTVGEIDGFLKPFFENTSEAEVVTNALGAITLAIEALCHIDPELEACKQQPHLPRTARIFHAAGLIEEICKRHLNLFLYEHISDEKLSEVIRDVILKADGKEPISHDVLEFYLKPKEGYIHTLTKHWTNNLSARLQNISSVSTVR